MQETREAYWRDLFKRYLFVVIETQGTIFDDDMISSDVVDESQLTAIRQLADEAEDEYTA